MQGYIRRIILIYAGVEWKRCRAYRRRRGDFTAVAGMLAIPLCLYGTFSFVLSPLHDQIDKACMTRGLNFSEKGLRLGQKIIVTLIMMNLAVVVWMVMAGFYEGLYRMREEAGKDILAVQAMAGKDIATRKGMAVNPEDLKPVINRTSSTGVGPTFLADRQGNISSTMEEIAAASGEQAGGVDEVNRAITQIDTSTQQNASTVEELSGNAENLNREADNLLSMVKRFKVSQ